MVLAVSLTSISVAVGVVVGSITAATGVYEYRLKAKAQRAATDVELSRLFAELVPFATGTASSVLSEAVVTRLLERGDPPSRDEIASQAAIPVNAMCMPTQAAALMSIAVLGRDHPTLREPATAALATAGPFPDEPDLTRVHHEAVNLLVSAHPEARQLLVRVRPEDIQPEV